MIMDVYHTVFSEIKTIAETTTNLEKTAKFLLDKVE
jgi:hypothetical protein